MRIKSTVFIVLLLIIQYQSSFGADASQNIVKIDLTEDLVNFMNFVVWAAGIFLVILAGLGIAFFGFDIRKARSSMVEMTSEVRELLNSAKNEQKTLESAQQELEELRKKFDTTVAEAERKIEELGARIEEITTTSTTNLTNGQAESREARSGEDLVRGLIKSSSFNWTTIGRIKKKTGYDGDRILEMTRGMPDIEISIGKKTKDHIFRLKE